MNHPIIAPPEQQVPTRRLLVAAGTASLLFGVLLFVPLIVLGAAIDWPASLDEPATSIMPRIVEQADAVRVGYLVYLAYSIAFLPVVGLVAKVVGGSSLTRLAVLFAALSTLARSIGIIRWLTVLPALAAGYVATPDDAEAVVFDAINTFGGAIGELLGVSAFAAFSLTLLCVAILRSHTVPAWLGSFGFVVVAALLLPWLEVFGMDLGAAISVSSALVQLWFLVLGAVLLLRAARPGRPLLPTNSAARP
ncbi:DUF4386 family protein [Arthrobacter antioxidans]|uniref:DUF4386 family protein n=1 Tax=Arthrobacter antioxidans TaxID=2895818 RepID=UPI001FFE40CD|nr:DUF4386 family protein [Arthrobacter antioxidans]